MDQQLRGAGKKLLNGCTDAGFCAGAPGIRGEGHGTLYRLPYGNGGRGGGSGGRPEKPVEETFSQTPEQKELPAAIPDRILEFAGGLLPKTGERFPVELWCLMFTGGAILVLAVLAGRKR